METYVARVALPIKLAAIITCLSLTSACVGYVQLGRTNTGTADRALGQCSEVFQLPALQDPGMLPNLDHIRDDSSLVEYLSLEILRLREVVQYNNRHIQTEYRQYLEDCG